MGVVDMVEPAAQAGLVESNMILVVGRPSSWDLPGGRKYLSGPFTPNVVSFHLLVEIGPGRLDHLGRLGDVPAILL